MDNFHIDVTSEGKASLKIALSLAFVEHSQAKGYTAEKGKLVFYWCLPKDGVTAFPFSMDLDRAVEWAWAWLEQQDYGSEPDHDGDNGKGWRVSNEDWGHVDGKWEAFIAVSPEWAMYGK